MSRRKTDYEADETPDIDVVLDPVLELTRRFYGHMGEGVVGVVYNEIDGFSVAHIKEHPYEISNAINTRLRQFIAGVYRDRDKDAMVHDLVSRQARFYTEEFPSFGQYATAFFDIVGGDGFKFVGHIIINEVD